MKPGDCIFELSHVKFVEDRPEVYDNVKMSAQNSDNKKYLTIIVCILHNTFKLMLSTDMMM